MIKSSINRCRHVILGGICCVLLAPLGTGPATGSERVLHVFLGGTDGSQPDAQLIRGNDGALYGTTYYGGGGTGCNDDNAGCGTVFTLTVHGTEKVLYAFSGSGDGANPQSNLIMDKSGNLYGTTSDGGLGAGTVFKLASDGTETVLYDFQSAPDGETPRGNIVADGSGSLYGTTIDGGNTGGSECGELGCGIIFKVAADGTEVVLYAFQGGSDGYAPGGGVILDGQGNLYGTTTEGGGGSGCNGFGCGTVFELAPDGTETVLYVFQGGSDGAGPESDLIVDSSGNLYSTTVEGGASNRGTVFSLAPDGAETQLYAFTYGSDGYLPYAGLVEDSTGNLYGTTFSGGSTGCNKGGCGVVFKLAPDGTETVLHAFDKISRGRHPAAGLLLGRNGLLYGTTENGGHENDGVVFRLKK